MQGHCWCFLSALSSVTGAFHLQRTHCPRPESKLPSLSLGCSVKGSSGGVRSQEHEAETETRFDETFSTRAT